MKLHRFLILALCLTALIPLVSADLIWYPTGEQLIFFGFPLILIIPLITDAIALKIGLHITRAEAKSFIKLLLVLWVVGYASDLLTYIIIIFLALSMGLYYHHLLFILLSFVLIFVLDYLVLEKAFSFDKSASKKIAAVMGILTNMLLIGFVISIIFSVMQPVFTSLVPYHHGIQCVSAPINEIVTTIQKAQGGMVSTTYMAICLNKGEGFTSRVLEERVSSVDSVTFNCDSRASVCWGSGAQVSVATSEITALVDARFRARITCTQADYPTGNSDCEIEII